MLATVDVVGVLADPNVGSDVLGAFIPKAKGVELALALVVDVVTTVGSEGAVVLAVDPNANIGLLEPSVLVFEVIELVVGIPNEI